MSPERSENYPNVAGLKPGSAASQERAPSIASKTPKPSKVAPIYPDVYQVHFLFLLTRRHRLLLPLLDVDVVVPEAKVSSVLKYDSNISFLVQSVHIKNTLHPAAGQSIFYMKISSVAPL